MNNQREYRQYRDDLPQTPYDAAVYLSDAYWHLLNRDRDRGFETLDAREILVMKGMEAAVGIANTAVEAVREAVVNA